MGKPPGIAMSLVDGTIHMGVTRSTGEEDAIWDAVERAIDAGWTVERFRRECAHAWDESLRQRREWAAKDWAQP